MGLLCAGSGFGTVGESIACDYVRIRCVFGKFAAIGIQRRISLMSLIFRSVASHESSLERVGRTREMLGLRASLTQLGFSPQVVDGACGDKALKISINTSLHGYPEALAQFLRGQRWKHIQLLIGKESIDPLAPSTLIFQFKGARAGAITVQSATAAE